MPFISGTSTSGRPPLSKPSTKQSKEGRLGALRLTKKKEEPESRAAAELDVWNDDLDDLETAGLLRDTAGRKAEPEAAGTSSGGFWKEVWVQASLAAPIALLQVRPFARFLWSPIGFCYVSLINRFESDRWRPGLHCDKFDRLLDSSEVPF